MVVADVEGREGGITLEVNSCQQLKDLEDQIIDVLLILDSTYDTTVALTRNYEQFCSSTNNSSGDLGKSLDSIQLALQEKQKDIELLRWKMKALQKKVDGAISLVIIQSDSSADFVYYDTSTNTDKQLTSLLNLGTGKALKDLAGETRTENMTIRTLTEKGTHDAAAVKVLTIITLIYLPATVVSVRSSNLAARLMTANTPAHRTSSQRSLSVIRKITAPIHSWWPPTRGYLEP